MNHSHYVIIGGGAAGMTAAQKIREFDANGHITVLSEEPDTPYFRPMIPFVISGQKQSSDIALIGQGPYVSREIDVHLKTRVESVNTTDYTVSTEGKKKLHYDKLLIASGSRPVIPSEIKNIDCEGVFIARTLEHAKEISKRAEKAKQVVLLGGGMLNIKIAFALLEKGLEITIVELEEEVLPWLMEPDAAKHIHTTLENSGLNVITGTTAKQILSDSHGVRGIILDNGKELQCQMVCIGVGVQPNIDFLLNSGIETNQGVVINQFTESNVSNIYAAGDVAMTIDSITGDRIQSGLWTNAVEMGHTAGSNMTGSSIKYDGVLGILNATQVADMPFVSMGSVHTSGTDYETHVNDGKNVYRKMVFSIDGTKLIGALFIGDIQNAGLYRAIIREKKSIEKIKHHIIHGGLHYGHFMEC